MFVCVIARPHEQVICAAALQTEGNIAGPISMLQYREGERAAIRSGEVLAGEEMKNRLGNYKGEWGWF